MSSDFGNLIAAARLTNPGAKLGYASALNLAASGLSEYSPNPAAPADKGWRVHTQTLQAVIAIASVSLQSAPNADLDLFPRVTPGPFTPGGGLNWDVYLVDNTGAVVDAAILAAGSAVVLTVFASDGGSGLAP
jgi:hypothetical protein